MNISLTILDKQPRRVGIILGPILPVLIQIRNRRFNKYKKSDAENDFTIATHKFHKSFTSRKLNFYSEIEVGSDKVNNISNEIRPSSANRMKETDLKPNIVKGF